MDENCKLIEDLQTMIDINSQHLFGLRTECATGVELTQQQIRTMEGKLLKLYSKQIVAKMKISPDEKRKIDKPSLKQWFQIVGLKDTSIQGFMKLGITFDEMNESSEHDLKKLISPMLDGGGEEWRRLSHAFHNLRKYTEILLQRENDSESGRLTPDLHWDSWDLQAPNISNRVVPSPMNTPSRSPRPKRHYGVEASGDVAHGSPSLSLAKAGRERRFTPPPTPSVGKAKGEKGKFPTTPPPSKKHQTCFLGQTLADFPLNRSKSHESQLANRIEPVDKHAQSQQQSMEHLPNGRRHRLKTEPSEALAYDSGNERLYLSSDLSPIKSPPMTVSVDAQESLPSYGSSLHIPRSPRTPPTMITSTVGHSVPHRFTKTFKLSTCDFCSQKMFMGLKCKSCKYKCHRDCELRVLPSCGMPSEYIDAVRQILEGSPSPLLAPRIMMPSPGRLTPRDKRRLHSGGNPLINYANPDSSSTTSSCSSSTPSSPALLGIPASTPPSASRPHQFSFPDVSSSDARALSVDNIVASKHFVSTSLANLATSLASKENIESQPKNQSELTSSQKSRDSDKTVSVGSSGLTSTNGSGSNSTDSERTYRVDSQDSQASDAETSDRLWPRQNSLSLREWDIPYEEVTLYDPIGTGRFGTVYKGNWHGDVAIRVLPMGHLDDEKSLEAFKLEVSTFRKTRHENLVLFMGACMKPPCLAIITSMCRGMTLYRHLHLRKDKFPMNKAVTIAQQISQGMGYLHARGIVHKDLKTKNIFLENGKVVITDFGLSSVSRLCAPGRRKEDLPIPSGWLCYLAPEIMQNLRPGGNESDELPFSAASDIYAFGSVWYELLCGEWPWRQLPPETVIWMVGRGMKYPLANLQTSKDVKEILMTCWSYCPDERPEFPKLLKILERLPRKRLARSPSHPIHLSRSAESVF
ncbi:kinase suppressor of Ras 2-like [Artemia franciscana]|uniref:kinase suppressor of Ras 2-like n=1 Tax=Artemia franciscana TaxID=6661 RepID=UPI0032DA4795